MERQDPEVLPVLMELPVLRAHKALRALTGLPVLQVRKGLRESQGLPALTALLVLLVLME